MSAGSPYLSADAVVWVAVLDDVTVTPSLFWEEQPPAAIAPRARQSANAHDAIL
jgi:hypothetical protein